MMQANYAERTHKLNIVSLIGDLDASYKTAAEKALNSIYGRVGVTWEVELTKFDNDSIKNEILKDGLSIAADDESCWKKETREMKAIRKLYQNSVQTIDKDAAYLFVVNHPEEDKFKGTEGDMPRSQSVGYIFKDNVTDASKFGRLVAHEIGHGVYKFQHTFDYGVAEKSTDNLMDYNNGDFLAHYQWRVMQDSVMFVWGLFQDDEDGMGFFDSFGFHWIGCNTSSMFTNSKSITKEEKNKRKLVESHSSLFAEISECVGNKNPYVTEDGWTPTKLPEISKLLKQIVENKQVDLKKLSFTYINAKNYYYSDIDESYFSGRVFAFVFKNSPVLSDYKVADVSQLLFNKRAKACYYCEKYSMIPFYSETGELILALQFVPDEKTKKKYGKYTNGLYYVEFSKITTKIAEKLLVDPSLMIIKKEDAAILADHVYYRTDDPNDKIWEQIKDAFDKSDWEVCPDNDAIRKSVLFFDHSMCGFHSQLYRHKKQTNKYCYVTGGTDFGTDLWGTHGRTLGKDGKTDYEQVFGEYLYQYVHSVAAAVRLHNAMKKGMELCFVGHSLGGGLATCNSLATGCPAITFNPAAISEGTMEKFDEKYKNSAKKRVVESVELMIERNNEIAFLNKFIPQANAELRELKQKLKDLPNSDDAYVNSITYDYIKKIENLEKDIATAKNELKSISEEKEAFDDIMSSLQEESLYFISKEGENVLNYVIKGELVDRANSVTSYWTEPIGSYVYIDLKDNPKTKEYRFRHSIDRFLEYWGFIDPDKK